VEERNAEGTRRAQSEKLNAAIIESNIIFDLAFERDRNVPYLIELAGNTEIELIIPEYALVEADG